MKKFLFFSLVILILGALIPASASSPQFWDDFDTANTNNWDTIDNVTFVSYARNAFYDEATGQFQEWVNAKANSNTFIFDLQSGIGIFRKVSYATYSTDDSSYSFCLANAKAYPFEILSSDASGTNWYSIGHISGTTDNCVDYSGIITPPDPYCRYIKFVQHDGGYGNIEGLVLHVFYSKILPGELISRPITLDELQTNNMLVFDKNDAVTIQVLDKDNNVVLDSVQQATDLYTIALANQDKLPFRIKVTFSTPSDHFGQLNYIGLIPNKYYGYVYESGKPVRGVKVYVYSLETFEEPTGLTASTSGTGNITLYVYKDGQPLQNAKIKVWNVWGLEYFAPGATDAEGKINIIGIDTHNGWEATANYTFLVYDLNAEPVTDNFGNQLKVTVTFIDGIPQTNPAVIYNQARITSQFFTYTDSDGFFEFTTLNPSESYFVKIYNLDETEVLYNDTITPPYYAVYGQAPQEGTGGGNNSTPYGDPNSKYIVELSKDKIVAYETVSVFVKDSESGNYIEGADIYLDGVFTGKKTAYVEWWRAIPGFGWMFGWIYDKIFKPTYPVATVQITENGTHYIHAKVKGVESRAATVIVGTQDTKELYGGTDAGGSYPMTPPDELGNRYVLWADRTALYKNGEVTFKVYKYVNGVKAGSWEAMIYINDQYVGTTTKHWWNPFAENELTYKFTSPGIYRVHAVVEGEKTGNLIVTVYDSLNEFDSGDGNLNLQVYVKSAATGSPVSGAVVTRAEGDIVKERRLTGINGETTLHPASGVDYTIYVSDPSNRYLPTSQTGSWTSDDTLTFYLKPVGDLNNDNTTDNDAPETAIESIQIRIDGIAEDGVKLPLGKHRISVVDENGKELSDVEIYMNGERIGKTSGWFSWFGAGLEYAFSEPGEVTLHASYNGLADTITVNFTQSMNSYVLLAFKEGSDSAVMNNLEVEVGKKVTFTVAEVDASKKVSDWKKIEGAIIYLNGNESGVTKTIGGFLGLFSTVGFEKTFNQPGNYTVSAKYGDAETNSVNVTVVESSEGDTGIGGGAFGEFLDYMAGQFPLTGMGTIDKILWAIIIVVGGLLIVGIAIRVIL